MFQVIFNKAFLKKSQYVNESWQSKGHIQSNQLIWTIGKFVGLIIMVLF